ncbi:MAG: TolC family protein, partial [Bacteroidota bacterium]
RVRVEKHANLPGLSVGYASESVADESFKGVTMGLSIPLWSNKNKLEAAKAEVAASELQLVSREAMVRGQTQRLYTRCQSLMSEVQQYTQTLGELRSDEMLSRALELGELSVISYLQEVQFYYEVENELLQLEQSYQKALWELYRYKL